LRTRSHGRDHCCIEPPIEHRDVTTIMCLLSYIREDVREIRERIAEREAKEREFERRRAAG
jgi:hypothetical protein